MKKTNLKATAVVFGVMVAAASSLALAQSAGTGQSTEQPPVQPPAQGMGQGMGRGMGDGPMMGLPPLFDFAQLDADKDGKVTPEELAQHRKDAAAGIDADGNGTISLEEFSAHQRARREAMAGPRDTERFQMLDADADGQLTAAELVARPLDTRIFDRMDADGDGAVSQAEFDAARQRLAQRMEDFGRGGEERSGKRGHGDGRGWWGMGGGD